MQDWKFSQSIKHHGHDERRALISAKHFLEDGDQGRLANIYLALDVVSISNLPKATDRLLDIREMAKASDSRFAPALEYVVDATLQSINTRAPFDRAMDRERARIELNFFVSGLTHKAMLQVVPDKKGHDALTDALREVATVGNQKVMGQDGATFSPSL